MSAYSQLVNVLKTPGNDPSSPFPQPTSSNPCPQFMLMTNAIAGAYTISNQIPLPGNDPVVTGGATAACAVWVEYWADNNRKSGLIYTSQSLSDIQGIIA